MLELIKQTNTKERALFGTNVAAALLNVALALAFPDGFSVALNWFVAGVCTAMAANMIFVIRWRIVLDSQNEIIKAATTFTGYLTSPEYFEAKLREVFNKAKRDGVIPADVELYKTDQPKLH